MSKSSNFFPLCCCFMLYMNKGDAIISFFCIDILHCICRLLTFTWKLLILVCLDQMTAVLLETAKLNYFGKICKLTITTVYYLFMSQCWGKRGKIIHHADLQICANSVGLVRNYRIKHPLGWSGPWVQTADFSWPCSGCCCSIQYILFQLLPLWNVRWKMECKMWKPSMDCAATCVLS